MTTFTPINSPDDFITAFGTVVGIDIDLSSVVYTGDLNAASIVSDADPTLGIGAGILLTSGTGILPLTNTRGGFGGSNSGTSDSDLETIIGAVFDGATDSNDTASLEFTFTVTDPSIQSISFNVVFGSDEYPEFSDDYVDIAAVFVNGENYAYFGGDETAPLSVLDANLGYFLDNTTSVLPIEYDGLSNPITIFAPVTLGENTIKIAIADTQDSIYDSGIFLSDVGTSVSDFGGVFVVADIADVDGDNIYDSIAAGNVAEIINAGAGDDNIKSGGGADKVDGGAGNEVIDLGEGDDFVIDAIGDTDITGGQGADIGLTFSGSGQFMEDEADIEGDFYCGGFGADVIMGGGGNDVLIGDFTTDFGGADTITGGTGDDLLEGGVGADVFIFTTNDGNDTIGDITVDWSDVLNSTVTGPDFTSGIDQIHLDDFGYANTADAFANVADVDGVATFSDQGTSITFAGLTTADLTADDFVLI